MNAGRRPRFSDDIILDRIHMIRGKKVMLDNDLAALYNVDTKVLNQAVKRNKSRFPDDFVFQLTEKEFSILKSQFVTSRWGGIRKMPYAFTEQGVAMLSGVLKSATAVRVHIHIIRVFAKMKEMMLMHKDILIQLEKVEQSLPAIQPEQLNQAFDHGEPLLQDLCLRNIIVISLTKA